MLLNKTIYPFFVIVLSTLLMMQCSGPDKREQFKQEVEESLEHYYKGIEFRVKRNFEAAEEELMQSLAISPRPRTYMALSELAYTQNNLQEAKRNIDKALQLSPTLEPALRFQERVISEMQAVESVTKEQVTSGLPERNVVITPTAAPEEDLTRVVPENKIEPQPIEEPAAEKISAQERNVVVPESLGSNLQKAREAANRGDWVQTALLAKEVVQEDSSSVEAFYLLGYAFFQQKNYEEAEQAFRQTVRLDENHAKALNDLGITLEYLGRSAESIEFYQRSVEIGSNPDAFFNLALLEEKRGEYKNAISLYESYLQQDDTSSFADFARNRIKKLRRLAY